ncbi:MAG: DUF2812 domain-containing protein [Lachnospiraceae bacterium]|nr:DUF2812 domain-containing protein [Lachnospiraceae bacterium]
MKNKQVKYRYFTITQWKQEQEFLRQQHKNGWKFTKLNFFGFYHFERCEPEDVVYQLDFNPEGIAHKAEYIQMFRDCGWEYLQDYAGYSYFRKAASEMDGDEEIFCDDSSRLDFMKRVFNGRVMPLITIFLCIIIPQIFFQSRLDSLSGKIFTGIFVVCGVLYLALFLAFAIQFWKYRKSFK